MSAMPCLLEASPAPSGALPVPFATEFVTLTRQEHIGLVMQANYWKTQHGKALARGLWREGRYQRVLRQVKEQAALREATLRNELEAAQAKIRDLQRRVFGRKSERSKGASEGRPQESVSNAPRGQQRGKPGHGRTMQPHLPARVEIVELADATCPQWRLGPERSSPAPKTQRW